MEILFDCYFKFVFFFRRYLRKHFTEDVVRDLSGSASALTELEKEFAQLEEDRRILRQIFPTGDNKVEISSIFRLFSRKFRTFFVNFAKFHVFRFICLVICNV